MKWLTLRMDLSPIAWKWRRCGNWLALSERGKSVSTAARSINHNRTDGIRKKSADKTGANKTAKTKATRNKQPPLLPPPPTTQHEWQWVNQSITLETIHGRVKSYSTSSKIFCWLFTLINSHLLDKTFYSCFFPKISIRLINILCILFSNLSNGGSKSSLSACYACVSFYCKSGRNSSQICNKICLCFFKERMYSFSSYVSTMV